MKVTSEKGKKIYWVIQKNEFQYSIFGPILNPNIVCLALAYLESSDSSFPVLGNFCTEGIFGRLNISLVFFNQNLMWPWFHSCKSKRK